jgi:hypothetical protein
MEGSQHTTSGPKPNFRGLRPPSLYKVIESVRRMNCPQCGSKTNVTDSRLLSGKTTNVLAPTPRDKESIRRRRECANGHKFTTYETFTEEGWEQVANILETRVNAIEKYILAGAAASVHDRYEALRLIIGCTRDKIAGMTGIDGGQMAHLLRGDHGLTEDSEDKIDEALHVLANEKLGYRVDPQQMRLGETE